MNVNSNLRENMAIKKNKRKEKMKMVRVMLKPITYSRLEEEAKLDKRPLSSMLRLLLETRYE